MLGTILQQAFASPVLPRRTKALMFAVVARSLECGYCEGAARGMLSGEGFSEAQAEACLATLTAPMLEPFELKLLHWVRGTIHYESSAAQNQTRVLAREIGPEATLEAVGVAALANATARLAMLLE
jgi:alkylhydroperoxidase family enzyme